jgi:F-type H+-transporting ATPase subunit delta
MNQSKISVRYAKAIYSLALEQNLLEQVRGDMDLVYKTCVSLPDFSLVLESPIVKTSDKQKMISQIFTGKIQDLSLQFLLLIARNKRENYLRDITRYFLDLYKREKGIKTALLTSAVPLDNAARQQLVDLIKKTYGKEVEMSELVEEKIVGGFILRLDDQQYDASVSTLLKKLKQELINTTFEKKIG